ncbi:MAG TPA: large conductance mechanosensitive channel protein MscL [Candidatus Angelobacter sp.]|nr:large conductance mechanosensitive channel protein MscL [Candidatus Angelobacter sp.]
MLKGFREFVMRGNVIDLAVGIVIGAAFTALVNAFVVNLINPLLGVFGTKSLNAYVWCLKEPDGGGTCLVDPKTGAITGVGIGWGAMLSAIITFLLTALVVYYVFVVPMNRLRSRFTSPAEAAEAEEIVLLREIRDSLRSQGS